MSTAVAADELKVCLKKKAGSATTNWSADDHTTAPTTGDALQVLSVPAMDRIIEKVENEAMGGETAQSNVVNGSVRAEFQLEHELYYDDAAGHLPLAMGLGTSGGSPSTPGGGSSTRDQAFTPAVNIHGLVASAYRGPTTSQASNQPSASICPSAAPRAFTIEGEQGGVLRCSSDWLGIDVFRKPAPTDDALDADITLTAAEADIAAATLSATGRRIRFADLTIHIDDEDGGDDFASVTTHVVQATRFSLRFERDIKWPEYGSQAAGAPDSAGRPMLPVNNRQHVVPVLTLQLPRWENDNFFGRSATNIKQRIRLEAVGDLIEGSLYQRFRIDLPSCVIDHGQGLSGNLEQTITARCYQASSTPTGFSSADFCRVDVRNTKTSDILA